MRRVLGAPVQDLLHARLQALLQGGLLETLRGQVRALQSHNRLQGAGDENRPRPGLSRRLFRLLHLRPGAATGRPLRPQARAATLQAGIRERNGLQPARLVRMWVSLKFCFSYICKTRKLRINIFGVVVKLCETKSYFQREISQKFLKFRQ